MFKVKDSNGNDNAIFEVCDNDYSFNFKRMKTRKIISFPILTDYVKTLTQQEQNTTIIPTGIEELDKIIGGGLTAGLYVIGANPGVGKTSLLLHIALNLSLNKKYTVIFNLEMSNKQLMSKMLANLSYRSDDGKFTINEILSNKMYNKHEKKYNDSFVNTIKFYEEKINDFLNIITYNEQNDCKYIENIYYTLKNYQEVHNLKPIIMIDFLQLLQIKTKNEYDFEQSQIQSRRLELDKIISALKNYSNIYKVPIIIISSLSRSGYTRKETTEFETEYSLASFKETGQIEYTADFIVLLTKSSDCDNFDDEEVIFLNILKNRFGKTGGKLPISFIPEYSYFYEQEK